MNYLITALQGKSNSSRSEADTSGGTHLSSSEEKKSGLYQCSEYALALGEVHTKLDDALNFLQTDVGYCLLTDARPDMGGGATVSMRPDKKKQSRLPAAKDPKDGKDAKGQAIDLHGEEILMKDPETIKYAYIQEDLILVSRWVRLICKGKPQAWEMVKENEGLFKTVLQGVRLMHLCEYQYPDIVLVLAYGSVYFKSTFEHIGHKMSKHEAAHVCVLLIYLAHSFLLDETCPLRCWQKHIFRKYCTLKVLDAALYRLFKMRNDEKGLRITDAEQKEALQGLGAVNGFTRAAASNGDAGQLRWLAASSSMKAGEAPRALDASPNQWWNS